MIKLYIDADSCPVKNEVFRVARRHGLKVYLVSNSMMRIPPDAFIELIIVREGFDAADDWIATHITETDIAVTADIPLAARIVAVPNCFDTITDSAYRRGHSVEDALAELRRCSGTQFDPECVDAFISGYSKGLVTTV